MAASKGNTISSFMEDVQRYECIYDKFSKEYKNRQVRENCWARVGANFGLTAAEPEKKYKHIRTAYGHFLRKRKCIHLFNSPSLCWVRESGTS